MVAESPAVPEADRTLILTRTIHAPRALVFQVWTEREHMVHWFGPDNFTLPFCEVDFRVGGKYRLCMRSPDGTDFWVEGTYREIVEPERIVFTWGRPEFPDETIVTITLAEEEGKTLLTLHHALFKTTSDRDEHRWGWSECLVRLDTYAADRNATSGAR